MKAHSLLVCAVMLLGCVLALPGASGDSDGSCKVQFDFGDGQVYWDEVQVDEDMNAFNVTMEAASSLGFEVNYSEFEEGVMVNGIDGIMSQMSQEYWHFLVWNQTAGQWEISSMGADSVDAQGLEAISWHYAKNKPDESSERPMATSAHQQPWTMFRHDHNNSGTIPLQGPITEEMKWEQDLDNGPMDSAVLSAKGKLYVATAGVYNWSSMDYDKSPTLFCLDQEGNVEWEAEYDGAGYQIASPLLVNDMVILPSTDGKLYAFDSDNGSQEWNFTTGSSPTGITSSPVLYRNQIVVGAGDGFLYSLHLNGTQAWRTNLSSPVYFSSPAVQDGTVYIGTEDGGLHAVAANGSGEEWSASVEGKIRSAPLLMEDRIVITYSVYDGSVAVDGGVAAFDYQGEELWNSRINATSTSPALTPEGIAVTTEEGLAMLSEGGEVQWNFTSDQSMKGSPLVAENGIYVTTSDNESQVHAFTFQGEEMWNITLPGPGDQYSMCSPTMDDDAMYVTADNGHLYAFGDVPPEASFEYSVNELAVYFDASGSSDKQGELEYHWDFGDQNSSGGETATHEYTQAGNYTVTLTVVDDEGSEDQVNQTVQVTAPPEPEPDENGLGDLIVILGVGIAVVVIAALMYVSFGRKR
ncbi:MAG: PQQ-binding-like beta-propeller repeat protein [Thermoplasmatota archaeon]